MLSNTTDQRKMGAESGHWIWQCQVTWVHAKLIQYCSSLGLWTVACQALFHGFSRQGGCHAKFK